MKKYDLINKLEQFAPSTNAEPWDCVGFISETTNQEITKIMLCLTPTNKVISQAISQNCDMIISHHPMFYVDCSILTKNYTPLIDIFSMHTNLDKANGGTTDNLIKTLELNEYKTEFKHEFLRIVELKNSITIENFTQKLLKISPNLRYVNNNSLKTLRKIAFCAGSGTDFIDEAKNLNCDCLVTGDLKFHAALDSEIILFDIGHFESEIIILPTIEQIIEKDIEIIYANEVNPFIYP